MQNKSLNQVEFQLLNETELYQIEGGFLGRDQLVHTLPIRFPKQPIKLPIDEPVILPVELPIRKVFMIAEF